MTAPKTVDKLEQLRQKIEHRIGELDNRTHGWLGVIVKAISETLQPDSALTAAAIAYFSLFSLFPLILLSIFIASFNLSPLLNQQSVLTRLEFIAPALGQLLGENIQFIIQTRGPITMVALIGLVWSASTVFYMLTQTLNDIWGSKQRRPVWERRGLAILFVLAFIGPILVLASFAGSVVANLNTWLPYFIAPLETGISLLAAVFLDIALFTLIYIIFPHGKSTWREILPGAIGGGLLWELAKLGFLSFVTGYVSSQNLIYGSVATIIAFLTWSYISGLIFLFGAYLSRSYYLLKQRQREAESV